MKKLSMRISSLVLCAAMTSGVIAPGCINTVSAETTPGVADYYEVENNWAKLLQYTMYFYDANMCGTDVNDNNLLSWRGNCHTYDSQLKLDTDNTNLSESFIEKYRDVLDPDGDGCVDVSGGFHDAGDHVKFGLPEAYAGSEVSWGYYEFREAYEKTGQAEHAETICRYFSDYFMRCTFRDENGKVIAFCYQVGDGNIDHAYWQSPEIDAMSRPGWFATSELPTTDDVSESAACLAINYLNFKDTDPEYAEKCLDYSKALYDFATENDKVKGAGKDGPESFYTSSKWEDDYCFAACWLYLITEDHKYLSDSLKYVDYYAPPGYVLCWNDMWNGVGILLGRIQDIYPDVTEELREAAGRNPYELIDFWYMEAKALNGYMQGAGGELTPAGYYWLNTWGSARYNTAAQFTALVYDKYNNGVDKYNEENPDYTFSDWALGQMEYLIGDNPMDRCYVVGFTENAAKFPHHRAASGLTMCEDPAPHKHVLYGALVGGPDTSDLHNDITKDWVYNEVTIDYNAAIVGAAAGFYLRYGDETMKPDEDFPPEEQLVDTDIFSGDNFWVSGYCSDQEESDGAGATKLTLFVNTDSLTPHTDISVRYYFDISEFENKSIPSSFVLQKTYDQVQTEVDGCEAKLEGPTLYKDNTYYVEISWPGYAIANSNKKYQFILGMYYGDHWDPTNDWSHEGIEDIGEKYDTIVGGVEYAEKCPNFCVYADGVLVGGTEPDGTQPKKVYKITQLVRLLKALVFNKPFTSEEVEKQFDFNEDGKVNIIDVVILKSLILESFE
ncbi:MAG: glycoside hydrolase family 9 protein [Oscillospiraceae bacterium]|nr:glycoside hydrolase family 9 protein [Oscillospiraceae bacterium]